MNKVFVIIVTYNGKQWYDRCLTSLRNSVIPVQTVIIDNASNDYTVEYIKENFPEIHLINSDINLGFGQGNNEGIRYALDHKADYVFLLNQDAWIEPDTISKLIVVHKENSQYGILSPIHLNADKTDIEKGLINYVADLKITDPSWINDMYFGRLKDVYDTNYVNAAAWLLPRRTLETVGGFDPIFYHYGEDDNYMHRVQYHGMKIGICPGVRIVHDTESRLEQTKNTSQTSFKNMLVELADINKIQSIWRLFLYNFRKAVVNFIKLNTKSAKYYLKRALFILKMRRNVEISLQQNRKQTISWL